jgi:hypothetical protein
MRIAVNRRALEINKRITDTKLHHPPILVEFDDGKTLELNDFPLPRNREFHVVYRPDTPWIEVLDDGEPIAFTVWIED